MTESKPIEVIHFRNEELLSVSERRARFEKEGVLLMAKLEQLLRTVGTAKFDPGDGRKILRRKMEEKQAYLTARGERLLRELPDRLARFLGEAVLFPPNGKNASSPVLFITSLDLRRLEETVLAAEVFLAKLNTFEGKQPAA